MSSNSSTEQLVAAQAVVSSTMDITDWGSNRPAGGDARFADAMCEIYSMRTKWDAAAFSSFRVTPDIVRANPHVVVLKGVEVCAEQRLSPSETTLEVDQKEIATIERDPAAWRQTLITLFSSGHLADSAIMRSVENASPEDLIEQRKRRYRMMEAAFRYQCPRTAALGYGPKCGRLEAGPGIIRAGQLSIRGNELDCDDARAIVANYQAKFAGGGDSGNALPGESPLRSYACTDSPNKEQGRLAQIVCQNSTGNPDPSEVVVSWK
ncbi:hypothetical protein [Tsukamurella spumae]|uniref:hypothetical protein n=1 Tax=Tsukamurella spumae TaxID=44753 RepID=UPI0014451A45|nr:hypothetical protein [Tsukamurella spumae]